MGILYVYVCESCVYVVPLEARGEYWISWNWSYRMLFATVWVLEMEPRLHKKQPMLLAAEPSPTHFFK